MTTTAPHIAARDKGLKRGALGLASSVVVGLASTAPAYSLAATLGLVIAAGGTLLAGVKAPAIMLISFIPMYLIAVAYQELNKAEPDCGTTFTWAARAFGPVVGWLGGWGIIASDVIVMANLAQIAGSYSFTFVGDLGWHSAAGLAGSTLWSILVGGQVRFNVDLLRIGPSGALQADAGLAVQALTAAPGPLTVATTLGVGYRP